MSLVAWLELLQILNSESIHIQILLKGLVSISVLESTIVDFILSFISDTIFKEVSDSWNNFFLSLPIFYCLF